MLSARLGCRTMLLFTTGEQIDLNAMMAMVMMHMVVRIMSRKAGGHLFWILGQCVIYVCMFFVYVCMDVCICVFLVLCLSLSLSLSLALCIYTFLDKHICMYIYIYIYMHTYIYRIRTRLLNIG